jgi:hypothetical protein
LYDATEDGIARSSVTKERNELANADRNIHPVGENDRSLENVEKYDENESPDRVHFFAHRHIEGLCASQKTTGLPQQKPAALSSPKPAKKPSSRRRPAMDESVQNEEHGAVHGGIDEPDKEDEVSKGDSDGQDQDDVDKNNSLPLKPKPARKRTAESVQNDDDSFPNDDIDDDKENEDNDEPNKNAQSDNIGEGSGSDDIEERDGAVVHNALDDLDGAAHINAFSNAALPDEGRPRLRAMKEGLMLDLSTVPYQLPSDLYPSRHPNLEHIEWIYIDTKYDLYERDMQRWASVKDNIHDRVQRHLKKTELEPLIEQYEDLCRLKKEFTITGVKSRGNGLYRCTIGKKHGAREPTHCGDFTKGKACVVQIIANYFVATNNQQVGHYAAKPKTKYVVSKDFCGKPRAICKPVKTRAERAMILYILDLELGIISDEDKSGKSDAYWDDLFAQIVEHVQFWLNCDPPIQKKNSSLVLACHKKKRRLN